MLSFYTPATLEPTLLSMSLPQIYVHHFAPSCPRAAKNEEAEENVPCIPQLNEFVTKAFKPEAVHQMEVMILNRCVLHCLHDSAPVWASPLVPVDVLQIELETHDCYASPFPGLLCEEGECCSASDSSISGVVVTPSRTRAQEEAMSLSLRLWLRSSPLSLSTSVLLLPLDIAGGCVCH